MTATNYPPSEELINITQEPEQPNQNLTIVKTIQQRMHVITNELNQLKENITDQEPGDSVRKTRVLQALDDVGIFEAGVLYKLQQEYE